MHPDEVEIDEELVGRLIRARCPRWRGLRLARVDSSGTDHALYRLGDEMLVRLPRIGWAVADVAKERRWLPVLAPRLPVRVPTPLHHGTPGEGYPWPWSVYDWLPGAHPQVGRLDDPGGLAGDISRFVAALHDVDPTHGPLAARGVPLAQRDRPTRAAIQQLDGRIDREAATRAWNAALRTPGWEGPPVWVHGDLKPDNLLLVDGRLAGVIDFGELGVGDPAVDLIVVWNLLPPSARAVIRHRLQVDDATWARGRGWALSIALIALPYYWETNPGLVANSLHVLGQVLEDD